MYIIFNYENVWGRLPGTLLTLVSMETVPRDVTIQSRHTDILTIKGSDTSANISVREIHDSDFSVIIAYDSRNHVF